MKLTTSLILPVVCWSAHLASASTARVYTYDPQSQPRPEPRSTTLEPVAARLVLAQRAGVEDYHTSDLGRPAVLDAINDYGLRTPLFAEETSRTKKAVILLETGQVSADVTPSLESYTSFDITPVPAMGGLLVDLLKQADPSYMAWDDRTTSRVLTEQPLKTNKGDAFRVAESVADFEAIFIDLARTNEWAITAVIMPGNPDAATQDQQTASLWGTYEMPGAESPLKKRQTKERPFIFETHDAMAPPKQSHNNPISALAANNTTPFRGIIPACFTSQSECESATRNCTGHGSCMRKYSDNTAQKDATINCFICACKATKSADGKLTTAWGGPACQKKDISVQFWLIVLFTVGLVGLIGFAVGTIADMGSAELPSVLGANVSGPSARK